MKVDTVTNRWANFMLEEATDEMGKREMIISPKNLSEYFEIAYELPFSPEEAKAWLEECEWYQKPGQ
jgi:hypothetical protein